MARILLALALAASAMLLLLDGTASAKEPSYLLTGGDLGEYALTLDHFLADDDGTEWSAAIEGQPVDTPVSPGMAYDLYLRSGTLAVPYQRWHGGPEMRFYPGPGLIQSTRASLWYTAPAPTARYLRDSIAMAKEKVARGELEADPFVVDLRDRRMHEVNYWLRPIADARLTGFSTPFMGDCSACSVYIADSEAFALKYLVDTVGNPPITGRLPAATHVIEFEGWWGDGGIGGLLGLYAAPTAEHPGYFWESYEQGDGEYFETTPGIDEAILAALAVAEEPATITSADSASLGSSRPGALANTFVGAGAAFALSAMGRSVCGTLAGGLSSAWCTAGPCERASSRTSCAPSPVSLA